MEIQKFGLMKFVEAIRACPDIETLAKFEVDVMAEIERRLEASDNHISTTKSEGLKKDLTAIFKNERFRLLSIPKQQQELAERDLGAQVGRGKFPHQSIGK